MTVARGLGSMVVGARVGLGTAGWMWVVVMGVVAVWAAVGVEGQCGTLTTCETCAANPNGFECGWCNATLSCIVVLPAGDGQYRGNCSVGLPFIIEAPYCDPNYVAPADDSPSTEDQIKDWFSDNLLYVIIGAVLLCFLLCLCIVCSCVRSKKPKKKTSPSGKDGKDKSKSKNKKKDKKAAQKAAIAAVAGSGAAASSASGPAPASASLNDVKLEDMTAQDMVDDLMNQDDSMFL